MLANRAMAESGMNSETAIVIVDHGSREAVANEVVVELARLVQARAAHRARVYWAHMELSGPSLGEAIDDAVGAGAVTVIVQPLFLAPGRHATGDIPRQLDAARQRHPSVLFRLGEVLGADPLLAELLLRRCGMG